MQNGQVLFSLLITETPLPTKQKENRKGTLILAVSSGGDPSCWVRVLHEPWFCQSRHVGLGARLTLWEILDLTQLDSGEGDWDAWGGQPAGGRPSVAPTSTGQ